MIFAQTSQNTPKRSKSIDSANSCPSDSLYSHFSHLSSSTLTMSDIPGTGRILDKYVFSRGGRALETTVARLAHRAGRGPSAAALRIGANLRGFSLSESTAQQMSSLSLFDDAPGKQQLRLELGLVQDVSRLKDDCNKLLEYSL